MSNCLNRINNIDVSNGKYIIENNYIGIPFDLYDNSNTLPFYEILNVPKEYPLGFYIDNCSNLNNNNNIYNDISNIIFYESNLSNNVKIYVSRGNDLSFNNGDYFRFYDESFNLLNISKADISTNNFLLTASADNFYFMKGVSYEFISTFDFSTSSPFGISGDFSNSPKELTNIDNSFILYIDNYSSVDNSNNRIYYYDLSKQDINGNLEFLLDNSGVNYYYGNIKFKIMNSFSESNNLSIKSYPKYDLSLSTISNEDLFRYNDKCIYVINDLNFEQYSLNNNNSECLTKISRADICLNYSKVFYEFNKKTHNDLIKDKIDSPDFSLNDLKYGIYDGSYVIFDICENYPITISSDYITIIENYPYTKKYEKYSSIVQNLNIYDPIYKNYTYYYGAIQFSLNSDSALTNDFSFDLFILNKSSNNISLDSSNSLIYTDFCEGIFGETNFLTNLDNKEFTFKLKNQANNIFEQVDFSKNENIYKLNKYDSYIELANPYIIEDKYGHTNLENLDNINLVISSAPSDFSSTQLISNNFTNSFVITYDFTYFDSSNIQLTRLVDIIDNVFIEFSESIQTKLFKNQSQYTNIIEISTNFYDESLNFFNDLEVFIKPNKNDKIFLPYEITITGIQLNQNLINESKNVEIVNYNVNKNNANNYINFNNFNHYLTDKILYIEKPDLNNIITIDTTYTPAFIIQYISSYSVEKNSFFYDISSIFSNSNNINDNSGSELRLKGTNNNNDADKNLINNLVIYDISNNLQVNDNSYTNIIYLHASNNIYSNIDISFILTLFNENNIDKFKFEAIANKDLSQNINAIDFSYSSDASFTISGEFFKNDFFKNKNSLIKQKNKLDLLHSTIDRNYELLDLLDSSFNGNYEFKIDVKGLETGDFIFNEISNNYGINRTDFSLSKIIYINVIDNKAPDLFFANPNKSKKGTVNEFYIPYGISFDILNSILFLNENTATLEDYRDPKGNPNIPIIVYNDNSIYNINKNLIDISYNFENLGNIIFNNNIIDLSDNNEDGSGIIFYRVKDLSNNYSNDISLTVIFKDIPALTISGNSIVTHDVNINYFDDGLNISGNFFTGISSEISISEPSNIFLSAITLGAVNYDISFSTDFTSSKIGTYEISYNVKFTDSTDEDAIAKLRRTINVVDRKKPFVRLFDFSGTNFLTFIDASNGLSTTISNEIFNELSYNNFTIDNSNNHIIDFSLTYLSSFHDLSRIIHAFDLCDNYTKVGTNTDDFSSNIILNISNNEINFSNSSFSTNDLSYLNYKYLNNDNSFIHVTQGIGSILPPLVFNYQIIDSCDNIFNFTRTVNIVDVTKPTIDFSLNTTTDPSYITYSIDKRDFSYQAFDYSKNQIQFLQEIQDIIFNFQINDNYTENNYSTLHTNNFNSMQNNYNITISANIISNNITFKNFNDFSNTIQNNPDIINLFKTFDNSFELIYDFSDNQYNSNFQKRTVNIVNEIKPTISVIADSEIINISFGDTSLNLTSFFNLSHPRLTNSDLSFELSYNLPQPRITSISNNDISALIYQFQPNLNETSFNDISFFNIATKSSYYNLSSSITKPIINIKIVPTNFQGFNNIIHEAGVYLSDASLINGLTVINEFDRFYYTLGEGSFNDVSYSGSIFDICYIEKKSEYSENNYYLVSFNEFQNDPSLIGQYRIKYSLTNQNNITDICNRTLFIEDTTDPSITIIGNNSEQVNINELYIEPGITFFDYGSRLNRLEYFIKKNGNDFSQNTITDFANKTTGNFRDITLLNIEDTSNTDIIYTITYIIYDNADLSSNISRTINVVNLNNLIIKPIIKYKLNKDSSFIEQILDSDFSSNSPSNYDISFYYLHSSKTIFYEATNLSLFNDLIEFTYNYILPQQLGSNVIFNNLQFFDPIESIIPNKVDNYLIFFQIFNNETFFNNLETIKFNVIDTRGPKLNFETNNEYLFRDICNIVLPLLSNNAYQELSNNINYFNKLEEKYPSFTKSNLNEEIIFSIPGVIVDDIVDNITTTLSNELFDTSFNNLYNISVSYKISGGINDGSYVDASYLLTNSGNYIQNYIITDSNNNPSDISRNITIKQFNPFIEINYNSDFSNNFYKKRYHKHYENYYDLNARAYDFSYIDVSYNIRDNNFNKNNLGLQTKTYITTNKDGLTSSKKLDIHIVNIDILKKDISLSSIIQDYNSNNPNNGNDENYKRYGVYKNNTYNIVTDGSSNAFRIVNDDSDNNIVFNTRFLDVSYSHLNNIVNLNSNNNIRPFNNNNYYYNNVSLQVNGDFNRLSIEYLDTSGTTQITRTLKDIILYNQYFETQNLTSNLSESIIEQTVNENSFNEIIVTVSNSNEYSSFSDVNKAFYLTHNNEPIEQRKTLYLPLGKYKFKQKDYTNFYNQIKFSYLPDGHFYDSSFVTNVQAIDLCNIGLTIENNIDFSFSSYNDSSYQKYEYTRGVQHFGLAGFNTSETGDNSNNGCTTLIISPTTPNPLFYYCKNFPKMGGIIYVTSNLVLYKNIINLNGSILTKENDISFANYYEPSYNEISNNLVFLSQHFDISHNTNSSFNKKHHTIGLTQENINHNIIFLKDQSSKKTNKLIFKKYQDSSNNKSVNSDFSYITNYKITEDNSTNYLYDSSATQLKTDILMYDFHIDTSNNIINSNNSYDYDINKIFFNSNELLNYYYYFKKYNLLQEDLISTSFKYRIGEVAFINSISIKNSEEEINFYDNLFFNNNRIVLEPLFQNKINLNLQVYIDPSSLTNPEQRLEDYNSEKLKYNLSNYQNIIDPNKILFQEYFINIFSDISAEFPGLIDASDQSIIFVNGNIELKDYLLDSSYTFDLLENYVHNNLVNDLSLENIIYLGIAETEDKSGNLFCGLTQQNIYHNMFIDDQDRIIFHPYTNNTYNNIYELNNLNNSNSRPINIKKLKNEKNYLIEVSSNDLYNTLVPFDATNDENIYSEINVSNKNRYMDPSNITYDPDADFKFKTRVSYKIYNELSNNDIKLNSLDIRPITLNDISNIYELYPYAYDASLQETHSHSYKINLIEHIDRNFYKNREKIEETGLTYKNIHYSKLYFVIKDISYNTDFNLYDSAINQNILYDKSKISILNNLVPKIFIINFKLDYFYEIINSTLSTLFNYDPKNYTLINVNNYQDLTTLISGDFIDTTYSLELPNVSLNRLFSVVLNNSITIINKYKSLLEVHGYYSNEYFITNNYNNLLLKEIFEQINQIENDVNLINNNIDLLIEEKIYFNSSDNAFLTNLDNKYILNQRNLNYNADDYADVILNEFQILLDLIIDFTKYKQEYNQINYELNLRGIISDEDMSNNDFIDLYKFYDDISGFYGALIDNMKKLNGLYLHDISNSNQVVKYITGEYWKASNNYVINAPTILESENLKIYIDDINNFLDNTNYNVNYFRNINYSDLNFIDSGTSQTSDISFQIFFWIKPYNNWTDVSKSEILNIEHYILGSSPGSYDDINFPYYNGAIHITVKFITTKQMEINFRVGKSRWDWLNFILRIPNLPDIGDWMFISIDGYIYIDNPHYLYVSINYYNYEGSPRRGISSQVYRTDIRDFGYIPIIGDILPGVITSHMMNLDFIDKNFLNLSNRTTQIKSFSIYNKRQFDDIQDFILITRPLLTNIEINTNLINTNLINFNNADFSSQFFIHLSNSLYDNLGIIEFSNTLYDISYNKYDLSLLKYFSDEISNNKIVDICNILITHDSYFFTISNDIYNSQTNSKDFSYNISDYYHDNSLNTDALTQDSSGIKLLKEDSYILNFNRSIYNQSIDEAYDHLTKSFNFDTINYILNGQELVINSFKSNNIVIEFDVYYNSYLYPNIYLDTIILDTFIPDLTPPTILFKTEVIDISQSSLTNDISSIARLLINDISYIDIASNSDISFDNDISFSYRKIGETSMNYLDNNVDDNSFVNIYIDISQVANATRPNDITYVYYTIYDNVNNMNIVKRRVNVVDLILNPIEFYYYATTLNEYKTANGEDKFDLLIKKGDMLTDNKIMENIRAKDTETDTFINLNNISYTLADGFAVNEIVTLQPGTYNNVITYRAKGTYNNIETISRNIRVLEEDIIGVEPEPETITHCCYPAVYYKPIQHNYKLGSSNSVAMRMAKFIINN